MSADEFFLGQEESRRLFDCVCRALERIGPADLRVTKSQIAFRRRKAFAWVWMPSKYLHRPAAPLVLTIALTSRNTSPRWKQVVEPRPGRFTHHLELYSPEDVDVEACDWLRQAWLAAE